MSISVREQSSATAIAKGDGLEAWLFKKERKKNHDP